MPTYTDPVIAPSFTGAVYDKGGAVFNVKAYGAVGNGLDATPHDDTQAIKNAVAAATIDLYSASSTAVSGRGSIVYFPVGVYRITDTIHLPSGVSIRGAGMRTSQLRFFMADTKDGLVWDAPGEVVADFHVGGSLEDVDVMTYDRDSTNQTARDLVVVNQWLSFDINRARIYAAKRYNLHITNAVNITATHLESFSAGTSNLYIDASTGTNTTTCKFFGCYFQDSQDGPGADVAGTGLGFFGCIFESSGRRTVAGGYGFRLRSGEATLSACYWENNGNFDAISQATAEVSAEISSLTIINPSVTWNESRRISGAGAFRFDGGTAMLVGGYIISPKPASFSRTMTRVFVAIGHRPEHVIHVDPVNTSTPGTVADLPGLVLDVSPDGNVQLADGALSYRIGGGTLIKKHISTTATWTPGVVANGATAQTVVTVPGASYGDTVVVSFDHQGIGLGGGVILFGSVAGSGNVVAVTLLNVYGSSLTFLSGTLRVDVWKH